jgi:hypothetical protein
MQMRQFGAEDARLNRLILCLPHLLRSVSVISLRILSAEDRVR